MKCAAWTNTKTQTSVCAGYPRLNSWTLNFVLIGIQFLRATARICHANPVRLSVCPSVTRVYCVKTAERIIEILSPSDRPNILVFRHQRSLRKSDGFTPNGGAKYKGVDILRPIPNPTFNFFAGVLIRRGYMECN